jgi:2-polyprenyl-6-methoxyphenol hydroxylase-like FAD-dependent oxidoreductase
MYDVVIAGGGPVGLFLACELRLANLAVLVLEQAEDPHSPLKRLPFGMRGLSAPTIEAFYRRGLLDDIATPQPSKDDPGSSASTSAHWIQQPHRPGGHFAGIQFYLDKIDPSKWPYRLPSPAGTNMVVEMEHFESILAARATAVGVEIRRGLGVEDLDQSGDDVTIRADGETFCGRWLVGCDGGRSTVRKVGGFEFVGTDPEFTGYSVKSRWPLRISSASAATTRRQACILTQRPERSRWSSSTGALSTESSRSRCSMCRRYCAVSPAPTSP